MTLYLLIAALCLLLALRLVIAALMPIGPLVRAVSAATLAAAAIGTALVLLASVIGREVI